MSSKEPYKARIPADSKKVVVPIVFIPGIMATRLQKDGEIIWNPDSIPWMLKNFVRKTQHFKS